MTMSMMRKTAMVSCCWPSRRHPGRSHACCAWLTKARSLLLHGAVKQEVGGQGLIPLAQQECLNAAVAVKAQALQTANGCLLLLCQMYGNCARGQACMYQRLP